VSWLIKKPLPPPISRTDAGFFQKSSQASVLLLFDMSDNLQNEMKLRGQVVRRSQLVQEKIPDSKQSRTHYIHKFSGKDLQVYSWLQP